MAEFMVLMRRDGEEMNVPAEKLQEFLDVGWVEISRQKMDEGPAEAAAPVEPLPEEESEEPKAKGKAPKAKGY